MVSTGIMSCAIFTIQDPAYRAAFEDNALGGLVGKILEPAGGFGKFLMVILMFSSISCNVSIKGLVGICSN